jgi:hypothetical protein
LCNNLISGSLPQLWIYSPEKRNIFDKNWALRRVKSGKEELMAQAQDFFSSLIDFLAN